MSGSTPASVRKPFLTPGVFVLIAIAAIGLAFGLARLFNGLAPITNLNDFYPWGIWIAIDVACGVALAAGGFTTAAMVEIFGGRSFKPLLRPAILTAWLGYFMVAVGLMFDLGRYWNVWRPLFNWQGNSVLFEVGMCVMAYLTVLTVEMSPSLIEGLRERIERREWGSKILAKVEKPLNLVHSWVKAILPIFIVAGVVLSCMHQSSLGTLMVIAPTKVSALWYTPFMPLLFLLSAMMVGFPMVIIESIIAHKSFGKKQDVGLLGSLARFIPYIMGVYAAVKFGDLIVRWKQLHFTEHADATFFWAVEIVLGVIAPLVLFSLPAIRRSLNWLLTASLLVVGGVVLNRINVYIVGYYPPYSGSRYFPAIGEIALTVGLACALMLLYRFFAIYFPILGGEKSAAPAPAEARREHAHLHIPALKPVWTAVFRGTAVAVLLGFVILYSLVHTQAIQASTRATRIVEMAKVEPKPTLDTASFTHAARPEAYRNLYVLNSPQLNDKMDFYEPVRFTHRTHDVNADSNCSVCHHRFAMGADDRIGEDIGAMHEGIEVRIRGASCQSCHEDLTEKEFRKCSQCHLESNEPDDPARIGLKGAYHRQCIGCHEKQPNQAKAPTDCVGCHHPLVPDHRDLLKLSAQLPPTEVAARCLVCHENTGTDILKTAHWNWQGPTPSLAGKEHSITIGLKNTIDNYDISLAPNPGMISAFHIGEPPAGTGTDDPDKIDCLVCHDTTGTYKRGIEPAWLDTKTIAEKVGRPSRANCGACHFYGGGGAGIKNGDLPPSLIAPKPEDDTHMGKVDMRCQDCHATTKHQIAGLSFNAPVVERRASCEYCHGLAPHGIIGVIGPHIDDHVKAVACETCHVPQFARSFPTQLAVDFSTAGRDDVPPKLQFDRPTYDKRYGTRTWGQNVVPTYRWFDGSRQSYLLGDPIDPSRTVVLNAPLGDRRNPQAKIYPFKVHRAVQPYDSGRNVLAAVKFENGLWTDWDWTKAVAEGMAAVGQEFSGEVGFVKTEMYTSVHHEVPPAKKSLGCADCHAAQNVACARCHTNAAGMNQPEHTRKVYPEVSQRFDFKALGYQGDPAVTGGRFYMDLRRGRPLK
jgi:octaheme c-type cytochrome (tetrathionate reductase family)